MSYNFDVNKFGWLMLPPLLRSKPLLALLSIILLPLVWVYKRFTLLRGDTARRLQANGQVIHMEQVLNSHFALHNREIFISDTQSNIHYLHFAKEAQQPLFFHPKAQTSSPVYLSFDNEGKHTADFIVNAPEFLQRDEHELRRLINFYKPAGKSFSINFYTYE